MFSVERAKEAAKAGLQKLTIEDLGVSKFKRPISVKETDTINDLLIVCKFVDLYGKIFHNFHRENPSFTSFFAVTKHNILVAFVKDGEGKKVSFSTEEEEKLH